MNWKWFWDFLNQFTIWFLDLLWRVHRLRLTVGLKQESHGPLRNHQHPFYKHMYHSHTYIYICVSAIIIVITIIISMIIRHDYNIIQSAVIKYHVRYIYIYTYMYIRMFARHILHYFSPWVGYHGQIQMQGPCCPWICWRLGGFSLGSIFHLGILRNSVELWWNG